MPFIYPIDNEKDFVYDLSLATQGVTVSQYNTGVNYYIGRGIDKDLENLIQPFIQLTKSLELLDGIQKFVMGIILRKY